MNFIAKLVGKCFRYFMLFALVLIGFESVNVFLQGQASFFELLATLAMLYLIYKFLVPLAERFLVFFTRANAAPQQRQAPRRRVGVVERFADSTGKAVSDWIMGSSAPVSSSGPDPRREAKMSGPGGNIRQRIGPSSMKNRQEHMPGTYDGYVASNRAKQARDDAKR